MFPPPTVSTLTNDDVMYLAGFCPAAKSALAAWFKHNADHPYPSQEAKEQLSEQTGLSVKQVTVWFMNARSRLARARKKASLRAQQQTAKLSAA